MAVLPRIQVKVSVTGILAKPRLHGQAMQYGLRQGAVKLKTFLPGHTRGGASVKYGYVRRKPSYVATVRRLGYTSWRPDYLSGTLAKSLRDDVDIRPGTQHKGLLYVHAKLGGLDPSKKIHVGSTFRIKPGQTEFTEQQKQIAARRSEISATTMDERILISGSVAAGYEQYIKSAITGKVRLR